ncbi:TPA: ArdC family protein [Shigella flexneri]|nr:ArdC family protein [Shigella flexneri]
MTMNLHTQTTAPKASQATSVSPLEQSGSSKTKFSRGKSKARAGAVKTDLYQTVTDSIIAALESGVKPWGHCCKVSDEAAFCLIQRPYISKTLLTRRISPRGSP